MAAARPGRLAGVLVVAALGAGPLRADYRTEFREGIRSFDRQDWPAVEARMTAALREHPTEDGRETIRISGTFAKAYLPYFYLGYAQAEQGRCPEALRAFARSEALGQITALRERAELERQRDRCLAVVVGATGTRIDRALAESEAARAQLSGSLARAQLEAMWASDPALGGEQERLERAAAEVRADAAALASRPDLEAAERLEGRASALAPAWRALQGLAESRAARLATTPAGTPVGAAPTVAAAAASPAGVPEPLLQAARAYFAGDYAVCLARLEAVRDPAPALAPQVDLFRAAAHFALARLGEDDSGTRLRAARAAAQRFRVAPGRGVPDRRYFPPDFLRFLAGG